MCAITQEESYEVSEDTVEMDELNSHECMAKMTALLKHLVQNKISPELTKVFKPTTFEKRLMSRKPIGILSIVVVKIVKYKN